MKTPPILGGAPPRPADSIRPPGRPTVSPLTRPAERPQEFPGRVPLGGLRADSAAFLNPAGALDGALSAPGLTRNLEAAASVLEQDGDAAARYAVGVLRDHITATRDLERRMTAMLRS